VAARCDRLACGSPAAGARIPGGVVAIGSPVVRIGFGGQLAPGGVGLLVGPPRGASATGIAWGNQHAQRGRGAALSIVPVTGQVDCMAPVPPIPAVVA